jgi:hypothetical protein
MVLGFHSIRTHKRKELVIRLSAFSSELEQEEEEEEEEQTYSSFFIFFLSFTRTKKRKIPRENQTKPMSTARRANLPPGNKPQSPIFPLGAQYINIVIARIMTGTLLKSQTTPSLYHRVKGGNAHEHANLPKHTQWSGEVASDEKLLDLRHGDIAFTKRSLENKRHQINKGKPSAIAVPVFAMGHVLRVPEGTKLMADDSDERRRLDELECIKLELNEVQFECFVNAPDSRADSGEGVTTGHRSGLFTAVNNGKGDIFCGDNVRVRVPRPWELASGHSWDDSQSGYRPTLWVERIDPKKMDFAYLPYIRSIFASNATTVEELGVFERLKLALQAGGHLHATAAPSAYWTGDALIDSKDDSNKKKVFFSDRYEVVWYHIILGMATTHMENANLATNGTMRDAFVEMITRIQAHLRFTGAGRNDDDGFIHGIQRVLQAFRKTIGNHDRNCIGRAQSAALPGGEFDIFVAGAGR